MILFETKIICLQTNFFLDFKPLMIILFTKPCVFCRQRIFGVPPQLRMPSNTFWTFTFEVFELVWVFHPREYLALLVLTRHKFLQFHSIVRLCWTSSNGIEPTHQSPIVVLISTMHSCPLNVMFTCICNVVYHCMSMPCHICNECHIDILSHTFNHVSWTIILYAYNFQNNHSFQCQYISIHISTFIKHQLSSMLLPIK